MCGGCRTTGVCVCGGVDHKVLCGWWKEVEDHKGVCGSGWGVEEVCGGGGGWEDHMVVGCTTTGVCAQDGGREPKSVWGGNQRLLCGCGGS